MKKIGRKTKKKTKARKNEEFDLVGSLARIEELEQEALTGQGNKDDEDFRE